MASVKVFDVIIIGGGPAGLTSAIYSSRDLLKTLVLEGDMEIGGQLTLTTIVENFPGFPEGVYGQVLMSNMRKQAEEFGAKILSVRAVSVDFSKRPFSVTASDGNTYSARAVIIATGASARMLGLESEKILMGRGVSTCATCDGFFFKGKEIFVVGGGDSAMEEALFLTRFAKKVTIIHRRDKLRASKIMQERAKSNPKISFLYNKVVKEVLGVDEGRVTGVLVEDVNSGVVEELKGDGLFLGIGHHPNTSFLRDSGLEFDSDGYIKAKNNVFTNIPGVFVAGDVHDSIYRQAITASALGCMAAMQAEKFLSENE